MPAPLVVFGHVAQCLRVLRFAHVDLADGRMVFLYIHDGKVAPGDALHGMDLVFRGVGQATNLTLGESLGIEVIGVMPRGAAPNLAESLLQMG